MNSSFFKLNLQDLGKGLVVAVLGVVLGALQQLITAHGFDFASYDWSMVINLAVTAGMAYIAKNLFSDTEGKFLGRVG